MRVCYREYKAGMEILEGLRTGLDLGHFPPGRRIEIEIDMDHISYVCDMAKKYKPISWNDYIRFERLRRRWE